MQYERATERRLEEALGETGGQHKERLIRSLQESLGEFERAASLNPVLLEEADCGGYIRQRVELTVVPGLSFGAYVLVPKGSSGKLPGVIALHGHGYGSRQICGLNEDGTADSGPPDGYHHFAVQLAGKGMIVIAPDVIGFGERRMQADLAADPGAPSSCYRMSTQLLMLGKTLTGLRVHETLGALDYFAEREDVDKASIGIAGFSGGSLIAFAAAALDERLRASVLIGFPNTFQESIMAVHHCFCNFTPGILTHGELPELMGLLAPRPLFLESGQDDPIFPAHGFKRAVRELQEIYRQQGAENRLAYDLFPGAHQVSGRVSFDWLRRSLTGE